MILLTKIPTEGTPFKFAINKNNLIEISPKGEDSWCKYWDGGTVRSCVIQEKPEEIVESLKWKE
jgi:hypothetical protein